MAKHKTRTKYEYGPEYEIAVKSPKRADVKVNATLTRVEEPSPSMTLHVTVRDETFELAAPLSANVTENNAQAKRLLEQAKQRVLELLARDELAK